MLFTVLHDLVRKLLTSVRAGFAAGTPDFLVQLLQEPSNPVTPHV